MRDHVANYNNELSGSVTLRIQKLKNEQDSLQDLKTALGRRIEIIDEVLDKLNQINLFEEEGEEDGRFGELDRHSQDRIAESGR